MFFLFQQKSIERLGEVSPLIFRVPLTCLEGTIEITALFCQKVSTVSEVGEQS